MPLTVTWIAPTVPTLQPLNWLGELGRMAQLADVELHPPLVDDVTLEQVATALRQRADVVVFAGHGTPGGLALSDTSIIGPAWWSTQVSLGAQPRLAIMAACGSQERTPDLDSLVQSLAIEGITSVGFPAQTEDRAAAVFTLETLRALARGSSEIGAFRVGMEMIKDSPTARGVFITAGFGRVEPDVVVELVKINAILAKLLAASEAKAAYRDLPAENTKLLPQAKPPYYSGRGMIRGVSGVPDDPKDTDT